MTQLLEHIKVVDAASYVAGPGAATVLSDFGANVIKIEPFGGDGCRTLSGAHPTQYGWLVTSRNKRSIALDLNTAEGRGIVQRLLDDADVLVHNFFDDQAERYGLGFETLKARNSRLIYARMSGFGTRGPDARRRGFDSISWWARTGLMDVVRDKDQPPVMGAPAFGDFSSAMSLFGAIMLGLYRRELSGEGGVVETSLLANGIWANSMQVQGALAGFDFGALRQEKGLLNPFTSVYGTADGRYLLLAVVNVMREWPGVCEVIGHADWAEQYADVRAIMKDRIAIKAEIARVIGELPLAGACERLDAANVTYSLVQNLQDVIGDEQARAAEILIETHSDQPDYALTVSSPIQLTGVAKRAPARAPAVGEHTREILSEAGYSAAEIAGFFDAGAVAEPG